MMPCKRRSPPQPSCTRGLWLRSNALDGPLQVIRAMGSPSKAKKRAEPVFHELSGDLLERIALLLAPRDRCGSFGAPASLPVYSVLGGPLATAAAASAPAHSRHLVHGRPLLLLSARQIQVEPGVPRLEGGPGGGAGGVGLRGN